MTEKIHVPARDLVHPAHLSDAAKLSLTPRPLTTPYPDAKDLKGWETLRTQTDQFLQSMSQAVADPNAHNVEEVNIAGVRVYKVIPKSLAKDDRNVVLEMHGGALVFGGGECCKWMAMRSASKLNRAIWTIDYRMPPDHPYPAGLDDCINVYKALLKERKPNEIIFAGNSAGGNLVAALTLRARDEGLPLPVATILQTPEVDLTESGDSFQTNNDIDSMIRPFMHVNLMYAAGQPLETPYISPLFGDLHNFPPTIITGGTRDLFLSNVVRMHRKLRKFGVQAELHILEAAGHIGLPGSPEGEEMDEELRRFVRRFWGEEVKATAQL